MTSSAPRSSERRDGVIIVGSVTADVTTFSSRLPARGETILGDDVTLVLGGKGANQAIAAARAGGRSWLIGCVGSDLFRPVILEGLARDGVSLEHLRVVEAGTGVAHIRVDASGENDIVIVPRANSALSADQVSDAIEALSARASVLLTQLEIPIPVALHAIRVAHAAGLQVILDPAPATALPDEIWPGVDIVTPNETEATIITGIEVTDASSAARAGRWFVDRGVKVAIVTLGSAGAMVVTADGSQLLLPIEVRVVDTTAAGDAFAGYLGAALASGASLPSALDRALAAGALAVTRKGASPSLPFAAEVDELRAVRG